MGSPTISERLLPLQFNLMNWLLGRLESQLFKKEFIIQCQGNEIQKFELRETPNVYLE